MYTYEKGLFEVASHEKTNYALYRFIYTIISSLYVVLLYYWINFYVIIFGVILVLSIVCIEYVIKRHKKKAHQRRQKTFHDIFYPAFIHEHPLNKEETITLTQPYHDQTFHGLHTRNLETFWLHLKQDTIHMSLSESIISGKKRQRMTLVVPYSEDVQLEIRSYQRVSESYPIKVNGSGYMLYSNQKDSIQLYKNIFERMFVYKNIDQLDIKIKNKICLVTFKLEGVLKPLRYNSKEDVLLKHKECIHQYLDAVSHILHIIKEPYHAYRK